MGRGGVCRYYQVHMSNRAGEIVDRLEFRAQVDNLKEAAHVPELFAPRTLLQADERDPGYAVQRHAEHHGYSVVREFCGHGIGEKFHEEPQVLHYGRPGAGLRLDAGMTFTIEPMINAGKPEIRQLADGWTVVTKDHSLSAQWEHTVLVTEGGYEVLTLSAQAPEKPPLHG